MATILFTVLQSAVGVLISVNVDVLSNSAQIEGEVAIMGPGFNDCGLCGLGLAVS